MVSPLENARANPRGIQLKQLLESGITSVTQRNGYKRGYPLSHVDYTVTKTHILYSAIRY